MNVIKSVLQFRLFILETGWTLETQVSETVAVVNG
jgi:hypothetical protein